MDVREGEDVIEAYAHAQDAPPPRTLNIFKAEIKNNVCSILFGSWTHLPTKNTQSPVSRKATRTPTHISVENGDSRLKEWSSESALLRMMKLSPVWMKGVVMSTKRSLTAVTVSGATARSASWYRLQQQGESQFQDRRHVMSAEAPQVLSVHIQPYVSYFNGNNS